MSKQPKSGNTGYLLERIYSPQLLCSLMQRPEKSSGKEPTFQFRWDWRISDHDKFEILLTMSAAPTFERPEQFEVTLIGAFQVIGQGQSVTVPEFAKLQGPALLAPYIREAVSNLTSRGAFGAVFLPPLNIVDAMNNMDPDKSTAAQQMRDGVAPPVGQPRTSSE